ncbi:MAG: ATP-binding cassette domain-containing protein, partial [Solirubrobacteraceae bacterium]
MDGLDLKVDDGAVMALLGPNGAGKTTTVRMLATLLVPDAGTATVAGHDVVREAGRVREVISLTGQFAAHDHACHHRRRRGPIPSRLRSAWVGARHAAVD